MLVAISGSPGSGKSTVLQELKKLHYPVIERKTARSILNDWGVTLDAVNADIELKQAFQEELLRRKLNDEIEASMADEVVFTERTFSDLFTYALISFGQYNKYDVWLDNYYEKCKSYCEYYDHVFYIKNKFFNNIEKDGVRSINKHYSRMIDNNMLDITKQMMNPVGLEYSDKVTTIIDSNILERVDIITSNYKR